MDNNNTQRYNLETAEFKEREQFFKQTLNINLRDYFTVCDDNEIVFETTKCCKDMLHRTLADYQKADSSFFADNFDLDAYISNFSDNGASKVPIIVFDRNIINQIYKARGDNITQWMQTNLKSFSDQIIVLKNSPSIKTMADIMVNSSVISIDGLCCDALIETYGAVSPLAPVAMEGAASAEEASGFVASALSVTVVCAVITAAIVIATILIKVSLIERKLVCLIVNDTKYDISIEDIYMHHGEMTQCIDDQVYKSVIPGKKRENEVYTSFFVIEKGFGLVGTECTMRLRLNYTGDSFYLLTANPLSEKSRINFTLRNDDPSGHRYSSKELHSQLYSSGNTAFYTQYRLFDVSGHLNSAHGKNAYSAIYFKQEIDDYANLWHNAEYFGSMYCVKSDQFEYNGNANGYEIKPGGFCCFATRQPLEKMFFAELMAENADNTDLVCSFGGEDKVELANNNSYAVYPLPYIYDSNHPDGSSENAAIRLSNRSASSSVYIRYIVASYMQTPISNTDWMSNLPDETPLEDINIPGTHDSAAINKHIHTPYACHYSDITEQLTSGIRLLDVRIRVKNSNGKIVFATCHGDILSKMDINEYQSLESLLDECKDFLNKHQNETIIMSLKIDDYAVSKDRNTVYKLLAELLSKYPIREYNKKLGNLGNSRGKIVLFNRIDSDWEQFGYPISWTNNTQGSYAEDNDKRDFKVYVQDYWDSTDPLCGRLIKWRYVEETMEKKKAGDSIVVWNYASACRFKIFGLYIGQEMLDFFGLKKSKRLTHFGWVLMDYEDSTYPTDFYGMMDIPSIIIASNFDYAGCSEPFNLINLHDCHGSL